jgi:hypothetical protein
MTLEDAYQICDELIAEVEGADATDRPNVRRQAVENAARRIHAAFNVVRGLYQQPADTPKPGFSTGDAPL